MNNEEYRDWLKVILQVTFSGALVTANLTAVKLVAYPMPVVGTLTGSVAAVAIGVNFFCTDLLCEVYGKREARKAVNASIIAMIVAYALVFFAIEMPAAQNFELNEQFITVFSSSYPIIIASILSILVSQNLDISIFHAIKSKTGKGHKWVRNIGSTATSQAFDTAFFTVLAFVLLPPLIGGSALPWGIVIGIITAEYIVKVVVAVLDTPLFYAASAAVERTVESS